ncbi:hypothetical protein ACEQPO_26815 [Bacillus sp. SL00103]
MRALFPDHLFERVIEQRINVPIDQNVQLFFDEIARVGTSLHQTKALTDQVTLYQLLIVVRKKGGSPSG